MKIQGQIVLKKGREASAKRFHPWIFSGAIHSMEGKPSDGDWVEVKDASKQTLGFEHYQQGTITIRLLTFTKQEPSPSIYREKLGKAFSHRVITNVVNEKTNCYRLVHGEGDGLPGLIIDIYNGVAVMQAHSAGMHSDRQLIAESI